MKHIFKQFEGTNFKFDTHSYSIRNIQTRCVGPNDKVTLFCGRHFIFINLRLLLSNLSIAFWNSDPVTPTLSTFYHQVHILLDSGWWFLGLQKITISTELYSKENNIIRAFNKISIKEKV